MFGLTSTLDGWPFFPGFDEFSMGKNEKNPVLKGFDPLGINAQGGFFSQIARLVEVNVCANFEKKSKGSPHRPKFFNRL